MFEFDCQIKPKRKFPKRGKCPCGGYYQDWHSHASDCIAIGGKIDFSKLGFLNPALRGATKEYHKKKGSGGKVADGVHYRSFEKT